MNPPTDKELEALLDDVESDRAERKQAWAGDAPEKTRQAVCAYANDLPNHRLPGIVFIGARDDGAPSGTVVTDQLLIILSDIKTDGKTVPPPTLTVEKRVLKGVEMAVITVWPADAPRCVTRVASGFASGHAGHLLRRRMNAFLTKSAVIAMYISNLTQFQGVRLKT